MKKKEFKKLISESQELKACLELCSITGIVARRENSGQATYAYERKTGPLKGSVKVSRVNFGEKGLPDICGHIPKKVAKHLGSNYAIPFYWEVKRYGKKIIEGSEQHYHLKKYESEGCICGSGTCEDLEKMLIDLKLLSKTSYQNRPLYVVPVIKDML